jgi:mitochondrial import inner membrane translocase subunit TIM16
MAIGPLARILAQIVVPVVAVLARALPAAYAQALHNARRSGAAAAAENAPNTILKTTNRISTSEALSVLNLSGEIDNNAGTVLSKERIEQQYEKYMKANAPVPVGGITSGGSFYLQSKIYRAREQLLQEYHQEKAEQQQQQQQQSPADDDNDTTNSNKKS